METIGSLALRKIKPLISKTVIKTKSVIEHIKNSQEKIQYNKEVVAYVRWKSLEKKFSKLNQRLISI